MVAVLRSPHYNRPDIYHLATESGGSAILYCMRELDGFIFQDAHRRHRCRIIHDEAHGLKRFSYIPWRDFGASYTHGHQRQHRPSLHTPYHHWSKYLHTENTLMQRMTLYKRTFLLNALEEISVYFINWRNEMAVFDNTSLYDPSLLSKPASVRSWTNVHIPP